MQELNFDVVIHLAGDQIIPNYIGVKLCTSPQHVVVVTDKTEIMAKRLRQQCETETVKFVISEALPAHDYVKIKERFDSYSTNTAGKRIGFNVTGGTKPMFAAALDFCRETGATPFYIDSMLRKVLFLQKPFTTLPMPPVFQSVAEFIQLAGYKVQIQGKTTADEKLRTRKNLSELFWAQQNLIRRWIASFALATQSKFQNSKTMPDFFKAALDEMLAKVQERTDGVLNAEWQKVFPPESDWRPAAIFAGGGWFEEYCFWQLEHLLIAREIKDLRLGCSPGWESSMANNNNPAQEFDLAFTDGYGLNICECKAGAIKQEYIQKLENLRTTFGGSFGRAILMSINSDAPTTQRIEQQKSISMISGKHLENAWDGILTLKPGTILVDKKNNKPKSPQFSDDRW